MRKNSTVLLAFVTILILLYGCSTKIGTEEVSIFEVVSFSQMDTALDNPIVLVDSYNRLKNKKLDISNDTTGWNELDGDHLFNYYGHMHDTRTAMITISRKSRQLAGIDVSDTTETPASERSLDRFIQAYSIIGEHLGEPQTHNVDILYSSDTNIPISELKGYLNNRDVSHSYYMEWPMQGGDHIRIEFNGTNSANNSHVTHTIYFDA